MRKPKKPTLDSLHRALEGKPSRYAPAVESPAAPPKATLAEEMDDGIPDELRRKLMRKPKKPTLADREALIAIRNLIATAQDTGWDTADSTRRAVISEARNAYARLCTVLGDPLADL